MANPVNTDKFDWSDTSRTRNALMSSSLTTMIIANVELTSKTISILGLTAQFDQSGTLAVAQLITLVIFIVYVLRITLPYVISINDARSNRKLVKLENELDEEHSSIYYDKHPYEIGLEDEGYGSRLAQLTGDISDIRKRTEQRNILIASRWETIIRTFVDQLVPLSCAVLAIWYPTVLSRLAVAIFV